MKKAKKTKVAKKPAAANKTLPYKAKFGRVIYVGRCS